MFSLRTAGRVAVFSSAIDINDLTESTAEARLVLNVAFPSCGDNSDGFCSGGDSNCLQTE